VSCTVGIHPRPAPYRRRSWGAQPSEETYRDADGLILMCMYCRRTRRSGDPTDRWDWVEAYAVQMPPRTTHGLCRSCLEAVLPKAAAAG